MNRDRMRFAAAAEALVGTPFRFRGRDRRTGLDCVGLVLASLQDCGRAAPWIDGYAMRQAGEPRFDQALNEAGFAPASGEPLPGDLLLARPGPAQLHLLVRTPSGLVHAHAGLGRVVHTPLPCPWPLLRLWRLGPATGTD